MSLFRKKKVLYVDLIRNADTLYSGKWNELPFKEELILQKSVEFFNDSDPCYIHRDAVRVRLLAELEVLWEHADSAKEKETFRNILRQWTDYSDLTDVLFSER